MNKDLEIVKALIKEMNEELTGKQKNIDVAAPFGKITGADFAALRAKKGVKKEEKVGIPQSADELPQHDGLYYVGGFIDIDGSPWVSKAEAEQILKSLTENHEGQDHEVSMANNSLDSILWAANELKKHLGDQERDIPAWIQDHITNAENYILQAAKNFHDYGAEEAPEDGLGLTNEDLMSTLGGERPFGDSEMRKNIVEPNLGPDYDAYIMFQGPKGQYDQAKQKYVKDMAGWEQLYRSSNYQGNAYISPDGNVIKASILSGGGIVGAIYVKKENEMSLQEMIKKVGSKYNVYSKKGKKLGSHPSKKKAQKQMAAIEISKQGK
jgi:hypothetical protein